MLDFERITGKNPIYYKIYYSFFNIFIVLLKLLFFGGEHTTRLKNIKKAVATRGGSFLKYSYYLDGACLMTRKCLEDVMRQKVFIYLVKLLVPNTNVRC